ncbi:hypothetical protein Pla175_02520 [Pirellulimonas nuda]|uniref:Uncharacterized protein n=1 Tax=Pirellulimonas nuda TaxID=2528009 RepID=A0A518D5Z6_9BACT|nr:hypothetical protein [Pirellulimonas nuda]QDU86898.1 hypothetical protein Pla175_02520 [Pirellulimonas nuda]
MRTLIRTLFGAVILGSLLALWASAYPGVLGDFGSQCVVFCLVRWPQVVLLLLLLLISPLLFWNILRKVFNTSRCGWLDFWLACTIPGVIALAWLTALTGTPKRLGFEYSRDAFDAQVAEARPSERPLALNKRLGIYQVDEWATDPRGGTYFRVNSGWDGAFGINFVSYGLVKDPNNKGTPFGAASYKLTPIDAGWHWFQASSDYH